MLKTAQNPAFTQVTEVAVLIQNISVTLSFEMATPFGIYIFSKYSQGGGVSYVKKGLENEGGAAKGGSSWGDLIRQRRNDDFLPALQLASRILYFGAQADYTYWTGDGYAVLEKPVVIDVKGEKLAVIKDRLQRLYDQANWSGYAEEKGRRFYAYGLRTIAGALGINLTYNCPA